MKEKSQRATNITCNISDTEKVALSIVAERRGYSTVAGFVRFCIDNECARELETAVDFILHGDVQLCTSKGAGE